MDSKSELLAKAMELFAQTGYDAVGVSKIVEEVGVTKPTLYHHYGNKEGLLSSILEQYESPFLENLETVAVYNHDILNTIESLTLFILDYYKRYPVYFQLKKYLHHSPKNSDGYRILKPFRDREFDILTRFFDSISSHHTGLKTHETAMAYSFLGMIDAFASHAIESGIMQQSDTSEWRKLAKQYLYGVFAV